ncbi:hypothetical protein [Glycomyces sp. YM15]|uniref:zinc finger domain-containing protein n=1 Tax=Glycomyces sp. YM15 TaxID=2800446 RepID=UPI0019635809|nr:hypothetical protein [Glycomyces sp. YM15]
MPKSRKRKKKVARSKKPAVPRTVSPVDVYCHKCNAAPGEECQPIRRDDSDFAGPGVHTSRGQAAPAQEPRVAAAAGPVRTDLAKEMHARLGFPGEPCPEYGLPNDPRTLLDPVDCVNALTACAIASALGCDACLGAYLPYVHGYEDEFLEPWVVDAAARDSAGQPPQEVSDRARYWHDMRHRLEPGTGRYLGPQSPGYLRSKLATVGPRYLEERLDLMAWQVSCANFLGLLTPTLPSWSLPHGAPPQWVRTLVDGADLDREEILDWVGTRMPKGAVKTAEYLTERWGVPVTADQVERLVEDGHLAPVGLYRSRNVYAPHHVDMLEPDMLDVDADAYLSTQWSERDEELLAAGTHPQSAPGYQSATPTCPHDCRSFVVDRPNDWGRACWHHLSKEEQAEIAAERSDIPSESGRYLLVDVQRARDYDCMSCGAKPGETCAGDVPHRPRILTARRWRRDLRAAGQWAPVPVPTLPRQSRGTSRPKDVQCPRCEAPAGKRCVTASGRPADEPHLPRRRAAIEAGRH